MNELNIVGLKVMAYRQIVSQIVDADNPLDRDLILTYIANPIVCGG